MAVPLCKKKKEKLINHVEEPPDLFFEKWYFLPDDFVAGHQSTGGTVPAPAYAIAERVDRNLDEAVLIAVRRNHRSAVQD